MKIPVESPIKRQTRSQTKELVRAFENLDIEHVDKLIFDRGIDLSTISPQLLTRSLWHAVKMQNAPLVRELLKQNPDLKAYKEPILMLAVEQFNVEIATMLINAGADVNEADYLHCVALCQDPMMHQLAVPLMEHGANLEARDHCNKSVMYYAVENDALGIVEELLRRGVRIRDDDHNDKSILVMAKNSTKAAEILTLLFKYDCINIETRDKLGLSAIFNLIEDESNRVDEMRTLLDLGVPVDQANEQGVTALHYAVNWNRIKMVNFSLLSL